MGSLSCTELGTAQPQLVKNNFVAEINLLKVLREQEMTKICPKMAHNEPKKPKKWSQMTKNLNSLKFLRM